MWKLSLRLAHQLDEDILERRLAIEPSDCAGSLRKASIAASSASPVAARDMQAGPERRYHVHARFAVQLAVKSARRRR